MQEIRFFLIIANFCERSVSLLQCVVCNPLEGFQMMKSDIQKMILFQLPPFQL